MYKLIVIIAFVCSVVLTIYTIVKECTKPKQVASFKESLDLVGLPIITFHVKAKDNTEKVMNFILDTGATSNFINKKWLEDVEVSDVLSVESVIGFGGAADNCTSRNVTLLYNSKEFKTSFLFVDLEESFAEVKNNTGCQLHGIIGSSFFTEYRYIIDFNKLKVYAK